MALDIQTLKTKLLHAIEITTPHGGPDFNHGFNCAKEAISASITHLMSVLKHEESRNKIHTIPAGQDDLLWMKQLIEDRTEKMDFDQTELDNAYERLSYLINLSPLPELTPSGELNTSHGCKCTFTDNICVDICAYHQDLENTNKAHEKKIDELIQKLAEYHNTSIGYTPPTPWKSARTAPMDGTEIYMRSLTPMRYKLYKPNSQEFKRGIKGRWQSMTDYGGWENCSCDNLTEWCTDEEGNKMITEAIDRG